MVINMGVALPAEPCVGGRVSGWALFWTRGGRERRGHREEKVTGQDPASGVQELTRLCLSFLLMSPRARPEQAFHRAALLPLNQQCPRGMRLGGSAGPWVSGRHLPEPSTALIIPRKKALSLLATRCELPAREASQPLQCPRLGPARGSWRATVHRGRKGRTRQPAHAPALLRGK